MMKRIYWQSYSKDNTVVTALDLSSNEITMNGVIELAKTIPTMRALVKFDVSTNSLCAQGGKLLAEALKGNNVIQELNIAGNNLTYNRLASADMSGVEALATAIQTMGGLVKFGIHNNDIRAEGGKALAEALKDNQVMEEPSCRSLQATCPGSPGGQWAQYINRLALTCQLN